MQPLSKSNTFSSPQGETPYSLAARILKKLIGFAKLLHQNQNIHFFDLLLQIYLTTIYGTVQVSSCLSLLLPTYNSALLVLPEKASSSLGRKSPPGPAQFRCKETGPWHISHTDERTKNPGLAFSPSGSFRGRTHSAQGNTAAVLILTRAAAKTF